MAGVAKWLRQWFVVPPFVGSSPIIRPFSDKTMVNSLVKTPLGDPSRVEPSPVTNLVQIYRLPALRDNYIFLLYDPQSRRAAVVDPAEPQPVLAQLQALGATLTAIFNTHHHGDHVGANADLLAEFPGAVVYGGAGDRGRIPGQQQYLEGGDRVAFGEHTAQILFVPGHTRAHIAYYFPPLGASAATLDLGDRLPSSQNPRPLGTVGDLFCGDTLFAGGCGRLFEGTPAQMLQSLAQFRHLPPQTRIWCAHEYTLSNLRFALQVDGQNRDLQQRWHQVQQARAQGLATVPSVLALEQETNPFLRWDQPALHAAMASGDPVETFTRLRQQKDVF